MTNAQNTHTTVNEERQRLFRRVMVYVALTVVTLIMAFPIIWMVSVSLKPTVETFSLPPRLLPNSLYLDGYTRIFENPQFRRFLLNSYLLGIVVTILSLAIGTLAAFGFSRYRFFGDKAAKLFVITTQMVPSITLLIPFFGVIVWLRLYDTIWGLVLTYLTFALPYAVIMMNGYLDTIPRDFDEAATIDGCSPLGVLFRVLLPVAAPGLISTAVYTFLLSWNEFLFALALTRSVEMRTVPVGISMMVGEFGLKWDEMMAFSVIGSLPVLVLFMLVQRFVVSGLSAGGIKG
ncbi:carbohydrate ABC transporter membrane protein 2 (CUT1 family) [Primorskyibacter sedentarius]|uniref:Carbohydrate ABC transporter membrane protein 2 (CUT1 family) n=1 Tax=Primorskyibacter sedentarius TaxID=745311 RepID=A0A4R3J7Z3_9RHOB|nr:carbohydrate ABC transporter permease [Primorskyibacter sedentarius]TCS61544.1 carbohydrate ABC transporter membrane protein 2 (CUT1 family) [Primorskyibacter sedentarius]